MKFLNALLLLTLWASLGITIWGQGQEIRHLRLSLATVSGVEAGLYNAQATDHKALLTCRLEEYGHQTEIAALQDRADQLDMCVAIAVKEHTLLERLTPRI